MTMGAWAGDSETWADDTDAWDFTAVGYGESVTLGDSLGSGAVLIPSLSFGATLTAGLTSVTTVLETHTPTCILGALSAPLVSVSTDLPNETVIFGGNLDVYYDPWSFENERTTGNWSPNGIGSGSWTSGGGATNSWQGNIPL